MANASVFKACRYRVAKLNINVSGTDYSVAPTQVSEIMIDEPFDDAFLPYFEITTMVPNSLYRAMHKENVELRCYIDLQKAYDNVSMNGDGKLDSSQLAWKSAIEGNFYCFSEDGTPMTNEESIQQYEQTEGIKEDEDTSNISTIKFCIYNENFVFASQKAVNAVFQDIDVATAIAWVAQEVGLNDLLCSPPTADGMEPLEQLIIPPYKAIKAIEWLANNYAMHDCGTMVFLDLKRGYILNKNAVASAWEPGEATNTRIESIQNASDSYGACSGCSLTNGEYILNMEENSIRFSTPSVVQTQTRGSTITVVDAASGNISSADSGATMTTGGENERVYANTSGRVAENAVATAVKEASKQLTGNFVACDLDAFAPNHTFSVAFTNPAFSKYGGVYRISSLKCLMQKDGDTFVPYINAVFLGGYQ